MRFKKLPPIEVLNELFSYDDNIGELIWNVRKANRLQIGDIAGNLLKEGNTYYRVIVIDNSRFKAHRIIYKMHNPEWNEMEMVDHINNTEIADNKIGNLRLVTHQQNQFNKNPNTKGSSKYRGVSYSNRYSKWKSSIMLNGKSIYLGMYENEIDAAIAYNIKSIELFGEHARPNII